MISKSQAGGSYFLSGTVEYISRLAGILFRESRTFVRNPSAENVLNPQRLSVLDHAVNVIAKFVVIEECAHQLHAPRGQHINEDLRLITIGSTFDLCEPKVADLIQGIRSIFIEAVTQTV